MKRCISDIRSAGSRHERADSSEQTADAPECSLRVLPGIEPRARDGFTRERGIEQMQGRSAGARRDLIQRAIINERRSAVGQLWGPGAAGENDIASDVLPDSGDAINCVSISFRERPASIMAWRTFLRAIGPNSVAFSRDRRVGPSTRSIIQIRPAVWLTGNLYHDSSPPERV
jgi:hypothetical protein